MKKFILFAGIVLVAAACKKDSDKISTVQTVSRPTIQLSGGQFYSINTGGSLPTVTGTAYDSTLNEAYPVSIVGTDAVDNTTPGLYIINAKATNRYGFYSLTNVYVAVTDIPESVHLEGDYVRTATGVHATITRLARGLYSTSNFFGAAGLDADAYFAQLNDTTIVIPPQNTDLGELETSQNKVKMTPGDTTISYVLLTLTSNRAVRTFTKQ